MSTTLGGSGDAGSCEHASENETRNATQVTSQRFLLRRPIVLASRLIVLAREHLHTISVAHDDVVRHSEEESASDGAGNGEDGPFEVGRVRLSQNFPALRMSGSGSLIAVATQRGGLALVELDGQAGPVIHFPRGRRMKVRFRP